jgi:peroxiredoxin
MFMKKLLTAIAGSVLFLAIVIAPAQGNFPGERAPDFTLKSISGKNLKLSEFRGRVILVNFWATWCKPCKEELPYFNRLYTKYRDLGLEILGINIDKDSLQASGMSQALNLTFPILLDPPGQVSSRYKIRSMPTTFVIGKDGTIRHIHWGFGPEDEDRYETEVRVLLKE